MGRPGIGWGWGGLSPVLVGGARQCIQRMRSLVGHVPGKEGGVNRLKLQLDPPPSFFPASLAGCRPPPPCPQPPASWSQMVPCDSRGWRSSLEASQHPLPSPPRLPARIPHLSYGTRMACLALGSCRAHGIRTLLPLRKNLACPRVWPAGLGQRPCAS